MVKRADSLAFCCTLASDAEVDTHKGSQKRRQIHHLVSFNRHRCRVFSSFGSDNDACAYIDAHTHAHNVKQDTAQVDDIRGSLE